MSGAKARCPAQSLLWAGGCELPRGHFGLHSNAGNGFYDPNTPVRERPKPKRPPSANQLLRAEVRELRRRIRRARRAFYDSGLVARPGVTNVDTLAELGDLLDLRRPLKARGK